MADVEELLERRDLVDGEINRARTLSTKVGALADAIERGVDVEETAERALAAFVRFGSDAIEAGPLGSVAVGDGTRRAELSYLVDESTLRAAATAPDLRSRGRELAVFGRTGAKSDSVLEAVIRALGPLAGASEGARPPGPRSERAVDPLARECLEVLEAYAAGTASWKKTADAFARALEPGARKPAAIRATSRTLAAAFDLLSRVCVVARDRYASRAAAELERAYSSGDPTDDIAAEPAVLFPVRLETRFVDPADPDELRIRIYPDQIHVDSHEPELTDAEVVAGKEFWATLYLGWTGEALQSEGEEPSLSEPALQAYVDGIDLAAYERRVDADLEEEERIAARYDELKARGWDRLVERFGTERAAYVVEAVDPISAGGDRTSIADTLLERPTAGGAVPAGMAFEGVDRRPESWTKRATTRLLPDRWAAVLEWDGGSGSARTTVTGTVVPRGLAIDPAVEPGSVGDEMDWLFDFDRALEVGMALSVPLSELEGFDPETDAIDSLLVVGVAASVDADEAPEAVRSLFDAHRFTDGLSLYEAGAPTNLESAPPEPTLEPPEPPGRGAGTDGELLARALALSEPGEFHPFERVPNGDATRYVDAARVNDVLWPATLGYYLRHVAVPTDLIGGWLADEGEGRGGDGDERSKADAERLDALQARLEWIDRGREHFVRYVRGGGPLPTVRVGDVPYGVLPVASVDGDAATRGVAGRIGAYVRGLRPLWEEALAGERLDGPSDAIGASPLDPAHDDWDVEAVLERSGVAHGARTVAGFTNEPERLLYWADVLAIPELLERARTVRAELERTRTALERGLPPESRPLLTDSRAGYLAPLDGADADGEAMYAHEFVDPDFGRFVDVLRGESLRRLETLTDLVPLSARDDHLDVEAILDAAGVDLGPLEPDEEAGEDDAERRRALFETFWDGLPPELRHALVLEAVQTVERDGGFLPRRFTLFAPESGLDADEGERLLDTLSLPRLVAATALTREYDDAGAMTSLLRALTHYATLQEYVDGRLRLGIEAADLPASDPDRTPGFAATYADVHAPVPEKLDPDGNLEGATYADVVREGIAGSAAGLEDVAPAATVEFGRSLEHLAALDRSTLASLTAETLDVASHRLDAWWTSLATARLFASREMDGERHAGGDDSGGVRTDGEQGLVVGGYGYVEDLRPDAQTGDRLEPGFVHAPSADVATSAALLRSGYDAAEGELREALAVDLSAERVRDALWLLDGVRRGTELGELLGARLERRMYEVTMAAHEASDGDEPLNLMRWKHPLREAYPGAVDQLERAEAATGPDESGSEVAHSDVLDGYGLLADAERDDFELTDLSTTDGEGDALEPTAEEAARFDDLLAELADDLDAVGDLLLAETTHQIARGDPEKGGADLEGLERGEGVPRPEVVDVPRTETGVTHRHVLLFDPVPTGDGETPRANAEPTLEAWVGSLLPARGDVECVVDWSVTGPPDEPDGEEAEEVVLEEGTETVTLADLGRSNLDLLALSGDHREGRSELDARIRYHLVRDGSVPADAALSIRYREAERDGATSFDAALEVARSVSALLDETRSVTGEDLSHPSEPVSTGYDEDTVADLESRYEAVAELEPVDDALETLVALLERDRGDEDGDAVEASVPERVDRAVEAAREAIDAVPFADVEDVLEAVAGDDDPSMRGLFALSPPGDASTVLLEEPGTFAETVPIEPEAMTDRTVVYESGERDPSLEGKPVEAAPLPKRPRSPRYGYLARIAHRRVAQTHDRLAKAREGLRAASRALANPALLADYEGAAGALARARARFEDAVDAYESALDAYESGRYSTAIRDATASITEASAAEEAAEAAIELAAPDGDRIHVEELPDAEDLAETASISAWGTDGGSWIDLTGAEGAAAEDGSFAFSIDLSTVEPGSWLVVTVRDGDDRLLHRRAGYVGRPDPELEPSARRFAWLHWARERIAASEGALEAAVDAVPWDAVEWVHEAADDRTSGKLEDEHVEAIAALTALAGLAEDAELSATDELPAADPAAVVDALDDLLRPWDVAALSEAVTVSRPSAGPESARYRIDADGPSRGAVAPGAAEAIARVDLEDLPDEEVVETLEAVATLPGEAVRELHRNERRWRPEGVGAGDPESSLAETQRRLARWLYSPDGGDSVALAEALEGTAARIDASGTERARRFGERLENALPDGTTADRVADVLASLAAELAGGADGSGGADADDALAELEAVTDALAAADVDPDPADAFRLAVLELVREPLFEAGEFGIYGAVPESPVGDSLEDERILAAQVASVASATAERIDAVEATAVPDADADVDERVEAALERLETLFGGSVPVLPPFVPGNAGELRRTFTDDPAGIEDDPLAIETWFQRAAQVVERLADEREALSYARALTGRSARAFAVGQLPFVPGDEWVGLDGVEPAAGTVSIVAGFATGAGPEGFDPGAAAPLAGVFVDEWVEGVAAETQDTGLALRYDAPGSKAPQSMLVAMPPEKAGWSTDALVDVVEETMLYAKLRSVDADDLAALEGVGDASPWPLLPAPYYAVRTGSTTDGPVMEPERAAWYAPRTTAACELQLLRTAFSTGVFDR